MKTLNNTACVQAKKMSLLMRFFVFVLVAVGTLVSFTGQAQAQTSTSDDMSILFPGETEIDPEVMQEIIDHYGPILTPDEFNQQFPAWKFPKLPELPPHVKRDWMECSMGCQASCESVFTLVCSGRAGLVRAWV